MSLKKFKNCMHLDTFHHTDFGKRNWKMLISFIFAVIIIYFLIRFIPFKNEPYSHLLLMTSVLFELLPVFIVGLLFGLKNHYKIIHKNFFKHSFYEIKNWIERFFSDVWNHKVFIAFSLIFVIFVNIVFNSILPHLIIGNSISSGNTLKEDMLLRQMPLLVLFLVIIAPLTEELIFRFWFPGVLRSFLGGFFKHHLQRVIYWVSAVISTFFWAAIHDPINNDILDQNVFLLLCYMSIGLYFQYLVKRTKSLTAPLMVHMSINLIGSLPILL